MTKESIITCFIVFTVYRFAMGFFSLVFGIFAPDGYDFSISERKRWHWILDGGLYMVYAYVFYEALKLLK